MSSSLSLSPLYKFPEWIIQDVELHRACEYRDLD
jgi:hypothetical protein